MNNPFVCESIRDGVRCGKPCSYVYKSAHAMRLVCDVCAQELQTVKGALGPAPVVEFSLLELVPAREALLAEREKLKTEVAALDTSSEMLRGRLLKLQARESLLERAGAMIANWLWIAIGYGVLATLVGVYYAWLYR